MLRAVLIDLDDTLLDNRMEVFLPAYFQRLGAHLSGQIDPGRMLSELLSGSQKMLENLDPNRTLERVFADHFYPALGFDEALLREQIEEFYRLVFPELKAFTHQRPEAQDFVEDLSGRGWDIAVATNPLFPSLAVEQRLNWAGFPDPRTHFQLITTYESFHFAKPHPEYYAEILAHLGVAPFEAVMIGDDPDLDLIPASLLGMGSFHLSQNPAAEFAGGDFPAALDWLEQEEKSSQRENSKSPRAIIARARGHLGAMMSLMQGLNEDACSLKPFQGEWSLGEIMCHLRDVEREVHHERLASILSSPKAHLVGQDTDAWAELRQYHCQPGMEAFDAFVANRLEMIERLEALEPEDWQRTALHTLLGPMKLNEVMAIANDHDTIHLAQLRKTLEALPTQP